VLGKGNADSYIGLRINFIPHHSPILVNFDEKGGDQEEIDLSPLNFQELEDLMVQHGFQKKELL